MTTLPSTTALTSLSIPGTHDTMTSTLTNQTWQCQNNPLISPPPEVIAQGKEAILDYLRNEAWWHLQSRSPGQFLGKQSTIP